MAIQSGKHCDDARCHSLMSNHVNSKHCLSPQIKKKRSQRTEKQLFAANKSVKCLEKRCDLFIWEC